MTNYIILALCIIIVLSYIFDITSKYSKIPGVILLIALGIGIQLFSQYTKLGIPNLKPVLPVIGTIGLILIVLEASLDLKLQKRKKVLIVKSISSAFFLFAIFTAAFAIVLTYFFGYSVRDSILNGIPLGIISSSVAIPSTIFLNSDQKEFVVYESSFSDIFGILIFDFILIHQTSILGGVLNFAYTTLITLLVAVVTTSVLAILLHKIKYHVNYMVIMTSVIMVYMLAQLSHLPALLVIITFGMVLSNNTLLENTFIKKFVDFRKFRTDLNSFRKMLIEFTFIARSFFFIIFGYYTQIKGLFDLGNLLTGLAITASIFVLRAIYLKLIIKMPVMPLLLFMPRGLITILLFLSIPLASRVPLISEEVITLVILMTIFILMLGNIIHRRELINAEETAFNAKVSPETQRLRDLEALRLKELEAFKLKEHEAGIEEEIETEKQWHDGMKV
jgi:Kef-type K+ transport system membrane component KefB